MTRFPRSTVVTLQGVDYALTLNALASVLEAVRVGFSGSVKTWAFVPNPDVVNAMGMYASAFDQCTVTADAGVVTVKLPNNVVIGTAVIS